jgi:hypothetical protein
LSSSFSGSHLRFGWGKAIIWRGNQTSQHMAVANRNVLCLVATHHRGARCKRPSHPPIVLTPSSFSPYSEPTPLSGLLALHIRRGDFIEHCLHLASWTSRPSTSSRDYHAQLPEEQARYRARCFLDLKQIVSRVREVRASPESTTRLTRIYALTNGRPEWLQELSQEAASDARSSDLDVPIARDQGLAKKKKAEG